MNNNPRTIVGGRSRGNRLLRDYPRGIEILLKKARVDDAFRERLLTDPLSAAESVELTISHHEKSILENTPPKVLETMIQKITVPKQHISAFRTARKAAALALLLGTSAVVPMMGSAGEEVDLEYSQEQLEIALEKMSVVQEALEAYRQDNGAYPSTEEWIEAKNPLESYLETSIVYDPWHRKFHYEAVTEAGKAVNYLLECLGPDEEWEEDNILCPVDTHKHSF